MIDYEKEKRKFHITSLDLFDLDELKARDLIVKCFLHAQYQTFERAKKRLGSPTDFKNIQKSITAVVKMAFKKSGHDFDKPTKGALIVVVEMLTEEAAVMGTPSDIISHHKNEMMKVVDRLNS